MALGNFGIGSASQTSYTSDTRQWHDSYNTVSNPTSALSDIGKVSINIDPPKPANPVAAAVANLDPRWVMTAGLLAVGWLLWTLKK